MQRTLLSSNPLALILVVLFFAGAIIFVLGTMLARERRPHPIETESQTQATPAPQAEPALDIAERLDLVERLVMVGQPWCIEQLDAIRREDSDESVREAADAALMVIGARNF